MASINPTALNYNNECTRILVVKETTGQPNARRKLTAELVKLGWYPRDKATAFIFWKRQDAADWSLDAEYEAAKQAALLSYPEAVFQYAVLRPQNDAPEVEPLLAGLLNQ